jgi:hypothetical protein
MWISEACYRPKMEGRRISNLVELGFLVPSWFKAEITFLGALQFAHDMTGVNSIKNGTDFFAGWEDRMRKIATDNNLIYTPPSITMHQEVKDLYASLDHDDGQQPPVPASAGCDNPVSYALPKEVFLSPYMSIHPGA